MNNTKDKSSKAFILKLLILAESDNKTYKYLKDNLDKIGGIEKEGQFAKELENKYKSQGEKEVLQKSKILLRLPPLSGVDLERDDVR